MKVTPFLILQFIKSYKSGNPHANKILKGKVTKAQLENIKRKVGKPRSPPKVTWNNNNSSPTPTRNRSLVNITSGSTPRRRNIVTPPNLSTLSNNNLTNLWSRLRLQNIRFDIPVPKSVTAEVRRRGLHE